LRNRLRKVATLMSSESGDLIQLPAPWLDADAHRELNETFYGTEPHEYFATRLKLLTLHAADPERVDELLSAGVEYGGLKIAARVVEDADHDDPDAEEPDPALEERRHLSYVVTEAVTLTHHLGETLLRLYLGHVPRADRTFYPVPWLRIAGIHDPKAFKAKLKKRFDGSPPDDLRRFELESIFYYARERLDGEAADALDESVDEIEAWLRHFAYRFLEGAPVYNSLKHGLTVLAGKSSFQIGTEERNVILEQNGPSVRYIERTGPENVWGFKTAWEHPDYLIVEGQMALVLLKQLIQVGRARYLSDPVGRLQFLREGSFKQFGDPGSRKRKQVLKNLGAPVGYLYPYEHPLTCSACGREARTGEQSKEWMARMRSARMVDPVCPECAAHVRT
jgi:hypothetical protein